MPLSGLRSARTDAQAARTAVGSGIRLGIALSMAFSAPGTSPLAAEFAATRLAAQASSQTVSGDAERPLAAAGTPRGPSSSDQLSVSEQERLVTTRARATASVSPRVLIAALTSAAVLLASTSLLWILFPPGHADVIGATCALTAMTLGYLVRFETPLGFTTAAQLAFVPLMFVLPPALLAPGVCLAMGMSWLPRIHAGTLSPGRLLRVPENCLFAIGPAWTLALLGAGHATLLALCLAIATQFIIDFSVGSVSQRVVFGVAWRENLGDAWIDGADFALSAVAYPVAALCATSAFAPLLTVPMLALLAYFAHERTQRLKHLIELNETYRGTALLLGEVIGADDKYTGAHCHDVVQLAVAVAEQLGLGADHKRNIEFAALLHDVGKIAVPKEIINKPGKLTDEEWAIMKTHCAEGEKMLARIGGFMTEVGTIVRNHHERWDGKGYPDGRIGDASPMESRIITACDSWNAMTTTRTYRTAMAPEEAAAEIRANTGTQFDPAVAAALLAVVAAKA
jgi:putative nucleotidyltransferase with HDIG domain